MSESQFLSGCVSAYHLFRFTGAVNCYLFSWWSGLTLPPPHSLISHAQGSRGDGTALLTPLMICFNSLETEEIEVHPRNVGEGGGNTAVGPYCISSATSSTQMPTGMAEALCARWLQGQERGPSCQPRPYLCQPCRSRFLRVPRQMDLPEPVESRQVPSPGVECIPAVRLL